MELKKDANGNIETNPIMRWTTGTLAGIGVLLAIEYAETEEQIETGGKSIQFAVSPQQCLMLAEKLTTLAHKVLEDRPPSKPH